MNLTQKLAKANSEAMDAHKQAMEAAQELLTALVEIGKVHDAYVLRVQIDWHKAAIDAMEHGEFGQ